jgi:citrate synthase
MDLQTKLESIIPAYRERVKTLVKERGDVKVDEVTIAQVYGGMRGIKSLVTDISFVDPDEGIRFRGYTIPETLAMLPKPPASKVPFVGGLFYLFLVGDVPSENDALAVEREWQARSHVPDYVFNVLRSMPDDVVLAGDISITA